MKGGVNLFSQSPNTSNAYVQTNEIVTIFKAIFALLMFTIKTEKKTLKANASCQNKVFS